MNSTKKNIHLLFVRMDKLGDLILSANLDSALNNSPESDVEIQSRWWVSQGCEPIMQNCQQKKIFQAWSKSFSISNFKSLYFSLKAQPVDLAVILHAPVWVALVLWLARVPYRIGRYSQWWSFIFYNKGVRQKRSRSESHESTYNFLLLKNGLNQIRSSPLDKQVKLTIDEPPPLVLQAPSISWPKSMQTTGLKANSDFAVVHPGMAGSALNWPAKNYCQLIEKLSTHIPVVITGTPLDAPFIDPIKSQLKDAPNIFWLNGLLSLDQLLLVLSQSKVVIAPSTGVLHMAASLQKPALGLYSPIQSHHPRRWGPRGSQAKVFVPNESQLSQLTEDQIMSQIDVDSVFMAAIRHVDKALSTQNQPGKSDEPF